jgi:REP element-mobilizing transposase RayT
VPIPVLNEAFKSIVDKWDASIVEFSGEPDYVHILLTYPPHKLLSGLIANMKSTTSKLMWDIAILILVRYKVVVLGNREQGTKSLSERTS